MALLRFVHLIVSLPKTLETKFEEELIENLKMQEKIKLTKSQTRLADRVYEAFYGESLEERDNRILTESEAEKAAEKALTARRLLKLQSLTLEQVAAVTDLPIKAVQAIQQDLERE